MRKTIECPVNHQETLPAELAKHLADGWRVIETTQDAITMCVKFTLEKEGQP